MTLPNIVPYALPQADEVDSGRVCWTPHQERGALLIHDMQRHFLAPYQDGWILREVVRNILRLRTACRSVGVPVFYSAQPAHQTSEARGLLTEMWGMGLLGDDEGARIITDLTPGPTDEVLDKLRYSAFIGSELEPRMRAHRRSELYICGVYAHIGCQTTAIDGFMRDIRPFVVSDATADFSRAHHLQSLRYIAGCCGAVLSTDQLVRALGGDGTTALCEGWRTDLAQLLEVAPSELTLASNLRDIGLDSVRLMTFTEMYQARHPAGELPSFLDMASCETVADLRALLGGE